MISETERVITGGSGDHTFALLIVRQAKQRVARAALLKTPRALEVFELAVNLAARRERQRHGRRTWRPLHSVFDALGSLENVLERNDHSNAFEITLALPIRD